MFDVTSATYPAPYAAINACPLRQRLGDGNDFSTQAALGPGAVVQHGSEVAPSMVAVLVVLVPDSNDRSWPDLS
jgi:hypothetical protein